MFPDAFSFVLHYTEYKAPKSYSHKLAVAVKMPEK